MRIHFLQHQVIRLTGHIEVQKIDQFYGVLFLDQIKLNCHKAVLFYSTFAVYTLASYLYSIKNGKI